VAPATPAAVAPAPPKATPTDDLSNIGRR
jgi:hypothetical protein